VVTRRHVGFFISVGSFWRGRGDVVRLALVIARTGRRRPRVGGGVAALISVAVAASRALLGVHWLTDVVAGAAMGWGWFLLSALVFGGRFQRLGDPAARAGASTRRTAVVPQDTASQESPWTRRRPEASR
jgi:membrane-associated phospholipid phosphatase